MNKKINYKIFQALIFLILSIRQLFFFEFNIKENCLPNQKNSNSIEFYNRIEGESDISLVINSKEDIIKSLESVPIKTHFTSFIIYSQENLEYYLKLIAFFINQHFIPLFFNEPERLILRAPPFLYS